MPYKVSRSGHVTKVWVVYKDVLEQRFLLSADRHWDNPHSDHDLQIKHLNQAREHSAGVLDFGDFFCAMQGKFDKRSDKSTLRPEHQTDEYFDALVDTATDFFAPYADLFIRIGTGNHETAIKKRHETDLIKRLVKSLNKTTGSKIHDGGYTGWVQFNFLDTGSRQSQQVNLWYTHGYGGGGPVTKGVIQTNRRAVYMPDAQIIVTGHIHEDWDLSLRRFRITPSGKTYKDTQIHVQVPSYKDEWGDGLGGFVIEGGQPPKPIGARWLLFRKEKGDSQVSYDSLRAE